MANRLLAGMAVILVGLNLLLFLLTDIWQDSKVQPAPEKPLEIPEMLAGVDGHDWLGVAIPHTQAQLDILAPAIPTKRQYTNTDGEPVWLVHLQTPVASGLHNVYDSLIASGAEPAILGEKIIQTRRGPLKASLLSFRDAEKYQYLALYWYQWDVHRPQPGSAANRWMWYQAVLKHRLLRKPTNWQLVEVIVLDSGKRAEDERRLTAFAAELFASGQSEGQSQ